MREWAHRSAACQLAGRGRAGAVQGTNAIRKGAAWAAALPACCMLWLGVSSGQLPVPCCAWLDRRLLNTSSRPPAVQQPPPQAGSVCCCSLEAGGHPGLDFVHLVEASAARVDAARVAVVRVLRGWELGSGARGQGVVSRPFQQDGRQQGMVGATIGGWWHSAVQHSAAQWAQRTCSAYSPDRRRPPLLSNTRNQA